MMSNIFSIMDLSSSFHCILLKDKNIIRYTGFYTENILYSKKYFPLSFFSFTFFLYTFRNYVYLKLLCKDKAVKYIVFREQRLQPLMWHVNYRNMKVCARSVQYKIGVHLIKNKQGLKMNKKVRK